MHALTNGIWAGLLATGPMTLAMFRLHRSLPADEQSPLPPATITTDVMKPAISPRAVSPEARVNLTMANHFAYGAACGALYAFGPSRMKRSPIATGALFGLGVWAGSYLGWLPAVGMRSNAFRMPAKRNALMILSHLVWGASLGFAENELRRRGSRILDGVRKAPNAE